MSKRKYHTAKLFLENLLAIGMKKNTDNKPAYLSLSVLEIRKIVMHDVWHD